MTVELWRIATDTPTYGADDMTGTGAKLTGGRWNRPSNPLIYATTSISLAVLETIVHLGTGALPLNRYLVRIDVPDSVWESASPFPALDSVVGWDAEPAGVTSLDFGDAWLADQKTALQLVPSVLVPEEWNVLVNPSHPDASRIKATKVRRFVYDARLREEV